MTDYAYYANNDKDTSAELSVSQFAEDLDLRICSEGSGRVCLRTVDINRPGLQFTGFYEGFEEARLQIVGEAERLYLHTLREDELTVQMQEFFSYSIPAIIITWGQEPPEPMLDSAKAVGCPVFVSEMTTSQFVQRAVSYLSVKLAPVETRHGVLVDVHGVGIFIIGVPGIGKSETALELVKRGHRLVADDAVELRRVSPNRITGEAPIPIRHLLEVRGIGIVDIGRMYGVSAVIDSKNIDIVVELEHWDDDAVYERLGMDEHYEDIMGVKVLKNTVPVAPGRNLAVICETAALNHRLRALGYHAEDELHRRLTE